MAHITEIKIDGLLGRKRPIHLKLRRDANVFFGENGAGKTTLLKVLDAAMSKDGNAMELLPVERAEVHIYSIKHQKTFKHTWERKKKERSQVPLPFDESDWQELSSEERHFLLARRSDDNKWKLSSAIKEPMPRGWMHTFLPTTRLYLSGQQRTMSAKQLTDRQFDELFVDSVNKAWLVHRTQVLSEVKQIQESGLQAVLAYALATELPEISGPSLDSAKAYDKVVKFLERNSGSHASILGTKSSFLKRYKQEISLRRLVDSLNTTEDQIEEAMIPTNRFLETIKEFFSNGKVLESDGNALQVRLDNGELISPANLSSGEKHLLKILLAAMDAGPNSVIIDEPELSMHIDWQRTFVEMIHNLNPQCQLILASHSPEVMAELPDEQIFRI